MNTKFSLLVFLLIAVVFVSGCTSDRPYEQPTKIESAPTQASTESTTATPPTQPEKPKIQTFNVGETATDEELKITVNKIRYTTKIDEKNR